MYILVLVKFHEINFKINPVILFETKKNMADKEWQEVVTRVSKAIAENTLPEARDLAYGSGNRLMIDCLSALAWDILASFALPKEHFKVIGKHEKLQSRWAARWNETLFLNDMLGLLIEGRDCSEMMDEMFLEQTPKNEDESSDSFYSEDSELMEMAGKMKEYTDNCREFAIKQFQLRKIELGEALFEVSTKGAYLGLELKSDNGAHFVWQTIDGIFRPIPVGDLFPLKAEMRSDPQDRIIAWQQREGETIVDEDAEPSPVPVPQGSPEMTLYQVIQEQESAGSLMEEMKLPPAERNLWDDHSTHEDTEE